MPMETPHPDRAREICELLAAAPLSELDKLVATYSEDPRKQVQQACKAALRRKEREEKEQSRVLHMYELQRTLANGGMALGVDEVGRGSIAGPLTVGAVILPDEPIIWGLNDSKQLTPARREDLAAQIAEIAIAIGIAHIEPSSIDAVGMATALRMGMAQAISDCGVEPDAVLIDGNPVHVHPKEKNVVKGDASIACIAAASIVAKVTRDALMVALDEKYPEYHLASCKGYASSEHIAAIRAHGLSDIHRVTFCGNFLETPSLF